MKANQSSKCPMCGKPCLGVRQYKNGDVFYGHAFVVEMGFQVWKQHCYVMAEKVKKSPRRQRRIGLQIAGK